MTFIDEHPTETVTCGGCNTTMLVDGVLAPKWVDRVGGYRCADCRECLL